MHAEHALRSSQANTRFRGAVISAPVMTRPAYLLLAVYHMAHSYGACLCGTDGTYQYCADLRWANVVTASSMHLLLVGLCCGFIATLASFATQSIMRFTGQSCT